METKPYRIQSPEDIAKDYGGNKQKIAQAMLLGVVDPTAGVLAGMFIDRMRSAQMQEMAPKPTVAQQVMGGAPPVPPSAPAGGLGATPQAAPPMAPPMAPPQEAPVGMAEGGLYEAPYMKDGGLSELPIPDTMFDEDRDGSYADGGLVAFAGGSPGKRMTDEEYIAYILRKESGGRGDYDKDGKPLTSKRGAKYAMQVRDDTARKPGYGVAPAKADTPEEYNRVGREYALALRDKYGDVGGAAAYNMGPGAYEAYKAGKRTMPRETQNYIAGLGSTAPAQANRAAPAAAPAGDFAARTPDLLGGAERIRNTLLERMSPQSKRREELISDLEASQRPEAQQKARKQNLGAALIQIGAAIATKPGGILKSAMEGVAQQLPQLLAGDERAKAQARADREMLMRLEDKSNEEKQQIEALALELAKAEAGLLSDERKLALQYAIAKMDDATRRAVAQASNFASVYASVYGSSLNARTGLAESAGRNVSNERIAGIRATSQVDPLGKFNKDAGGTPALYEGFTATQVGS